MEAILLKDITKKYGENIVLDKFSLIVEEGDYVSITGESGKGKTTLLNIMGMLDEPNEGIIEIYGNKNPLFTSKRSINLRRHTISYLFQNYGLIDTDSVENNIKISLKFKKLNKKEIKKVVSNALEQVGLIGYEKRKIFTLSGGEQQRVALAKIIAKSPKIILADEPTGSLDEKNRDYILKILDKFNSEGKTIIVVSHDPKVASCAKKHITL